MAENIFNSSTVGSITPQLEGAPSSQIHEIRNSFSISSVSSITETNHASTSIEPTVCNAPTIM